MICNLYDFLLLFQNVFIMYVTRIITISVTLGSVDEKKFKSEEMNNIDQSISITQLFFVVNLPLDDVLSFE